MKNEYQEIRSESWNMKNKTQKKFTQLHHSCSLKNSCSRIFFHGFDFHFGTCASSIQRVLVFGSGWVTRTWIGTLEFNISKVFTQGNTKNVIKELLILIFQIFKIQNNTKNTHKWMMVKTVAGEAKEKPKDAQPKRSKKKEIESYLTHSPSNVTSMQILRSNKNPHFKFENLLTLVNVG